KPVQNAYIESFNSRFRDECLSQHWFASLSHMRSVIDNWRDDVSESPRLLRRLKSLRGLSHEEVEQVLT
ncbi:transposase, partial [Ramlibacter sp. AW1]|nr:transposase [Ramlibacter aurantiacus]